MKTPLFVTPLALLALTTMACAQEAHTLNKPLDAAQITRTLQRAADWQLENPNGTPLDDWVIAPLYDGLLHLSQTTSDPKYLAPVVRMGTQSGWAPGSDVYFADDHAVGHAWLDIYRMNPAKKERLRPFQRRFDTILAKPVTESLGFTQVPKTPGVSRVDRWTWCDALYMGPPTLARLAQVTGDRRYLDFLHAEFQATYKALYDTEANLFYRDDRYIGRKSRNGNKVFWSRGNGWVFAGIPLMLEAAPTDWSARPFYTELLQKMAPAIVAAQQPDGLWYPSLLDAEEIRLGETSGSAFFVYGLAWGVNHGVLDRARYWPAIERGWNALVTRVGSDGQVGYVQKIGDAPAALTAESTQLYGTGGVLLAGSEILRALGAAKQVPDSVLLERAEKLLTEDRTPRAYARLVPERKDDLAWENDRVAYRVYGPALRSGVEASGIDAWAKKVPYPVLDRWYADDLAGKQSYHQDHGEGYDGYSVGDSSGCGGLSLWNQGNIVHADVYDRAEIRFTRPSVAEFQTFYTYPAINGTVYYERRTIRLRLGEHLNEIVSRFTLDRGGRRPAADLEVAVGLMAQTPNAEFILRPSSGVIALWDTLPPGKEPFGLGAVVAPEAPMSQQPHTSAPPRASQGFAIVRTDSRGEVKYRAGFGWPGDGKITSRDAWLKYLEEIGR